MRISRDDMLMSMAFLVAKRGTCSRLQVGAVFSRDGRVIVSGYNGVPAGMPHCDHSCNCDADRLTELEVEHTQLCNSLQPCMIAEHAERNGIAYAARHGLALEGSTLYVTHAPCHECARSIINAGVEKVLYATPYRLSEGLQLLRRGGTDTVYMEMADAL